MILVKVYELFGTNSVYEVHYLAVTYVVRLETLHMQESFLGCEAKRLCRVTLTTESPCFPHNKPPSI